MVTLRPIDDTNRAAVLALRVAPGQERFVSSVADSLRQAAEHPGAHPVAFAVHDGEEVVGFVMVADEVDGDDLIPQYLWKLLIDGGHQRRGLGTATLDAVVAWFAGRDVLTTCAHEGDGGPVAFYERYGFVRTGERHGGEVVLRLRLPGAGAGAGGAGRP